MKIKTLTTFFFATLIASQSHSGCTREPRTMEWEGNTIDVHIPMSPDITRIMLPEKDIKGFQASVTEGILYDRPNKTRIPNQLTLSTTKEDYQGLIMIDGESGDTYTLNLIASPNECDSQVKLTKKTGNEADTQYSSTGKSGASSDDSKRSLIYYMYNKILPRGFRKLEFQGSLEDRFVLSKGSVNFYAEYQYTSRNLIGTAFRIINDGRSAFHIDLSSIDYKDNQIQQAFGDVSMIGMVPFNFIIGPKPEKVSDLYTGPKNYGYLFVVSRK
jgi:hypothetical protein